MRVCLCDERMASGSGRLTALLCGCADGLQAVCSLTRPFTLCAAKRTGAGVQVRRMRWERGVQAESGKLGEDVEKRIVGKNWRVEEKGGITQKEEQEEQGWPNA